jgi:HlyD family secretion protein
MPPDPKQLRSPVDQPISARTLDQRRRARVLAVASAVAVLGLAAWGVNRTISPSVAIDDIRVSEVRRGSIANTINAAGVVIPISETQVSSPIQSRVSRVLARPGQDVRTGDLLLELDDTSLRVAVDNLREQVAQQENRVESLQLAMNQKLKQVASDIELMQLDLESAQVKLDRYERLGKSGAFSTSDLDAARLAVKRSEIELRQKRESVADTRRATATDVEGARLQKSIYEKQLAQQQALLDQTRVRAPFDGILSWVLADEGASVAAGELVAKVSKLHSYRVEATVSDFYARYLAPGQKVRVAYSGQELPGRVQTVLPEIVDGTVKLRVDLDDPANPLLRNKLRVDVNIVTDSKPDALVVDAGPAFNGRGAQDAFVVDGNVARKATVTIGLGDGRTVEVLSGARAGDHLIVSDTSQFKHLDHIRISR